MSNPRQREISQEAWRNIISDTTHAGLWALVLTAVLGLLGWADTTQVATITNQSVAYVNGGGATWMMQALEHIDGAACNALNNDTGIQAAGAIRRTTDITASTLPDSPLPGYEITPSFSQVLNVQASDGILLPQLVADMLGVKAGDTLSTSAGPVTISAVYDFPDDGRSQALGYAALSIVPTAGYFDECWASVWPGDETTTNLLYTSLTNNPDSFAFDISPKRSQLNPSMSSALDAAGLFSSRFTRWDAWIGLVCGLLIGFASLMGRRLEVASAIHSGWPRLSLTWQMLQESAVWIGAAAVLGASAIIWCAHGAMADATTIALIGLRTVLAGVCGAFLGVIVACATIRERQLFALFKQR